MMSIGSSFRAAFLTAAVFGCSPASALDNQAAWEGFMVITGATGCAGVGGSAVGDTHVSVYRPHIPGADTSVTFLSAVFLRSAFTLENNSEGTAPQMRGGGLDTTWIIDGRGAAGAFHGNNISYSNFIVIPTPAALSVSASTTSIIITGTINSYFNVNNCNVTFRGEYIKE